MRDRTAYDDYRNSGINLKLTFGGFQNGKTLENWTIRSKVRNYSFDKMTE